MSPDHQASVEDEAAQDVLDLDDAHEQTTEEALAEEETMEMGDVDRAIEEMGNLNIYVAIPCA
jgi:hypothetical protein